MEWEGEELVLRVASLLHSCRAVDGVSKGRNKCAPRQEGGQN